MMESIHGHEVIDIVANSESSLSRDTLKSEVLTRFGENCRFHTCMDSDLSVDDLLNFLVTKGKFIVDEQGIISAGASC